MKLGHFMGAHLWKIAAISACLPAAAFLWLLWPIPLDLEGLAAVAIAYAGAWLMVVLGGRLTGVALSVNG